MVSFLLYGNGGKELYVEAEESVRSAIFAEGAEYTVEKTLLGCFKVVQSKRRDCSFIEVLNHLERRKCTVKETRMTETQSQSFRFARLFFYGGERAHESE